MTNNEAIIARGQQYLLQNYRKQPIVIERGEGAYVWDADGRRYLDLICGVATVALGHTHPEVTRAAQAQLTRCWHTANGVWTQPQIDLAEKLTRLSGLERAFFCNSGAEANEAMLKLARKHHKDRGDVARVEFLAFQQSFHGRTLATLTATGQDKYHHGFEPLPPGFAHVPYGDLPAVRSNVGPRTAAIIVEPVQGEGGVVPAPEGFLRELRRICDETGALLLIDEIQTGMGRTGRMFGFEWEGIRPDAISLAKALANGLPLGAMLCREQVAGALGPGSHGSTFGGNLVACAAANAAVQIVSEPRMLEAVREKGAYLLRQLEEMRARISDKVVAVRGKGLLVGVEVASDARGVVRRCREAGVLVNVAGEKTVRMAPAFIVAREQLDEGVAALEKAIRESGL
ncbi:MAG TPA: aspartate aminotransferase family protein [Myxococcaceae bacterium]|nr:aspartate aminotransferase family protein [Myxococcaceae bacterium]